LIPRTLARALDLGRAQGLKGYPHAPLAYATVGHSALTPSYLRVEDGDLLVEVTLQPSGDEAVARVAGGSLYRALAYGEHVVVAFPGGRNGDPVVIARVSDEAWPVPSSVCGVGTSLVGEGPMLCYASLPSLTCVQTDDGADLLVHAGGSAQVRVAPGEQVLVTGRTHIGSDAGFIAPPVAPRVGPGGDVVPGVQATPYIPVPNLNTYVEGTAVPPAVVPVTPALDPQGRVLPADGVVRVKDAIQASVVTDPEFWAWLSAAHATLLALNPAMPPLPASVNAKAVQGSLNTVGDD